jgi:hypothetical protein
MYKVLCITRFLISIMDLDIESLDDAIDIIDEMLGFKQAVNAEVIISILSFIFDRITMQSVVQTIRLKIYTVVLKILQLYSEYAARMGGDFIAGFLSSIDGEKDPRNLIICFHTFRLVIKVFDSRMSDHSEELFEFPSCYFPITFRPPTDNPYGITANDLRAELHRSLTASPYFVPLVWSLIFEKFSSSSEMAITESLDLLVDLVRLYGIEAVSEKLGVLLNLFHKFCEMGTSTCESVGKTEQFLLAELLKISSDYEDMAAKELKYYYECVKKSDFLSADSYRIVIKMLASVDVDCLDITASLYFPEFLELLAASSDLRVKRRIVECIGDLFRVMNLEKNSFSYNSAVYEWRVQIFHTLFSLIKKGKQQPNSILTASKTAVELFLAIHECIDPQIADIVIREVVTENGCVDDTISSIVSKIAKVHPRYMYESILQIELNEQFDWLITSLCSVDSFQTILFMSLLQTFHGGKDVSALDLKFLNAACKSPDYEDSVVVSVCKYVCNSMFTDSRFLIPFQHLYCGLSDANQECIFEQFFMRRIENHDLSLDCFFALLNAARLKLCQHKPNIAEWLIEISKGCTEDDRIQILNSVGILSNKITPEVGEYAEDQSGASYPHWLSGRLLNGNSSAFKLLESAVSDRGITEFLGLLENVLSARIEIMRSFHCVVHVSDFAADRLLLLSLICMCVV